jgi:ketosteroid isomerase-like protein
VDAIVALHAPGMVFENHTAGERVEGEDVRPHIKRILENWPDLAFRGRRLYARDGIVVNEWTATATDGDGRRLEWDGVDIFPFRDGLIARKDVYSTSHRPRVLED